MNTTDISAKGDITAKGGVPVVNGNTGRTLVYGAVVILVVIIFAVTAITIAKDPVPEFLLTTGTLLVGFLIGSRVVTPDVSKQVTDAAATKAADLPATGDGHA